MKRINILYIVAIPLIYVWLLMCQRMGNTSPFFYGFAENKETELSHDRPVSIEKILVTPGQEVKKGDMLMEVQQAAIDYKIERVNTDIERLELLVVQQRQEIRDKIAQLKAKRSTRTAALEAEISNLEIKIEYHKDLMKDLKTIESQISSSEISPNQAKLNSLKQQLKLELEPINVELTQLEAELAEIKTPSEIQKKKLRNERNYYEEERNKLKILAPTDGLIGNILCKEGENINAFSTLINFYESNPTIVKGFVHESLILKVQNEDSLTISSSLHPENQIGGKIIGLGSRIVEIPERLRKMPDIKTYGREVLIQIPPQNPFLQKEKVMVNTLGEVSDDSLTGLFSFFKATNKKQEKKLSATISVK